MTAFAVAICPVFFGIFGVSWFTYCLHAAVMNALFPWVAFAVMRVGVGFEAAWAIGVASAPFRV